MPASRSVGSSYRVQRPSRLSTPRPPCRPSAIAVSGDITESIGAARIGRAKREASICHAVETSSGSRVRRLGTMAMSSKEYARRPRLARPISISVTRARLTAVRPVPGPDQPPGDGQPDGVPAVVDLQLAEHRGDVVVDGTSRQVDT